MALERHLVRTAAAAAVVALALSSAACSTKSSSSPAGSGSASAADVRIALVPGGAHPYFQPWKQAGESAAKDFGLKEVAFNETSQWDQSKQNDLLNSLAAQGYKGFGIFGVSPSDINTTFKNLKDSGVAVASLGSCPAGGRDEADFCLSTDVEAAAYKAAKAAIEAMGGKGNLVHLTGNAVDSNTQRRIAGVQKAVAEANGSVKLLTTITDIDKDLATAQKAVADLLAAHGQDVNGIVTTAYNPAVAAAQGVKSSNLPVKVVAIDDDKQILDDITAGSVYATVAQNPAGQAYVGSWALSKLITKACTMATPGAEIDSGSFLVTKQNVATYDNERQDMTKKLQQQFTSSVLKCS